MRTKATKRNRGVTLLELMVAVTILAITAIGALNYQFYAMRQTVRARTQLAATRTAQLLLEDWKSMGGSEEYDPEELELGFVETGVADRYAITVDNIPMAVDLVWKDIETDDEASVTLRQLKVVARWRSDLQSGAIRTDDPEYELTTYVRVDQASG